MNFEVWLNK
jgi:cullin 3